VYTFYCYVNYTLGSYSTVIIIARFYAFITIANMCKPGDDRLQSAADLARHDEDAAT